jgi:hypothetical protein
MQQVALWEFFFKTQVENPSQALNKQCRYLREQTHSSDCVNDKHEKEKYNHVVKSW